MANSSLGTSKVEKDKHHCLGPPARPGPGVRTSDWTTGGRSSAITRLPSEAGRGECLASLPGCRSALRLIFKPVSVMVSVAKLRGCRVIILSPRTDDDHGKVAF